MKRAGMMALAFTGMFAAIGFAPRTVAADATPTPTPTITATPTVKPAGSQLWVASFKAMSTVKQMHTAGMVTIGLAARPTVRFTGDCDFAANNFHAVEHRTDGIGRAETLEYIQIDGETFARQRFGGGPWGSWNFVPGYTPLALECPQFVSTDGTSTAPVKNRGLATIDGFATWHLYLRTVGPAEVVTIHMYVDQASAFVRRLNIKYIAPKRKDRFVATERFSGFNQPLDIQAPPVG